MTDCPYIDWGRSEGYCSITGMFCDEKENFRNCNVFKDFDEKEREE